MLIDDHTLFREGVRRILESEKDMTIIEEAEDGEIGQEKALRYNPDIILMDINMPKLNGLEVLGNLRDMSINSKIIILTSYSKSEYVFQAMKTGANGYVLKDIKGDILVKVIRDVFIGRNYLQPSIAQELINKNPQNKKVDRENLKKISLLTRREYEVLILIGKGFNNRQIGEILFISEKTVKNHITNIFKKIETEDRVQAVIFTYENNMLTI